MKRRFITPCFVACILFATESALRADATNAPTQPELERPHHLLAPTGLTANQPGIAGIAIGGPVGVLTDQQRTSYENALEAMRGRFLELNAKLRAARQDFLNTSVTVKFDENLIRQKALAAAQIEADLAVIRIKALSEVQPPLSPEQIEKIKSGRPGPMRQFGRPGFDRQRRQESPAVTNGDVNGLPPKQ
jgi:Spy/CpxP family protein refolding chaperone